MNGAAIFTQRLAKEMSKRGNEVLMIAPNIRFKDEVEKDPAGFQIFRVKSFSGKPIHPYFRFVDIVGLKKRMKNKIREFKPDIIHIQNHFSLGSTALKIARSLDIPIMGTNHFMPENLLQYIPELIHREAKKMLWRHFKRVYKKLDFITAPSFAAIKMLQEKGVTNKMMVISNGIDLHKFKKNPKDRALMNKYSIADNLPVLLFVGRLEIDKNIDLLLKATKIALKQIKFKVLLVGRGKNDKDLIKLSQKLGLQESVVFTGRIDDDELEKMYSLADIYMATGSAELQGIAVMEAMTAGLPVLAINAIALPELVVDGKNGYLFEKDEYNLAEKIVKILQNKAKWQEMSQKSLDIINEHDINKSMSIFEDTYRKVILDYKSKTLS